MSKREIDALMNDIPRLVKAAHASVKDVGTKNTADEATGSFGYDGDVVICPSDYGFDMFGATGEGYIKERSKEIAKQSLTVHGKPGSGADHADHDAFAGREGGKAKQEVESSGVLDGDDKVITEVKTTEKYGRSQEED